MLELRNDQCFDLLAADPDKAKVKPTKTLDETAPDSRLELATDIFRLGGSRRGRQILLNYGRLKRVR